MFRAIFQKAAKAVAAFSAGAINANISNRWATACSSSGIIQKAVDAINGVVRAKPRPPQVA